MQNREPRVGVNIYTELCPASAAAIIGAGVVAISMGAVPAGAAVALTGVAVGIAGPVAQSIKERWDEKGKR
jgi:hypothetical protein